ncbi:hypothetical protein LOZ51_005653 [Ophidiomyces ophidiicola]|nr:hypothetical protein LOZ54_006028 [Ophidiomyces ophidiicola]KAI1980296.1 hypothetical protein LOZ55_001446 [Ophidiomyces ophidiicola]KAI1987889.1 hypothetical protein LOZ51_005653 [Ophidiomyces ophidiicola]
MADYSRHNKIRPGDAHYPPYTPVSLVRELGIMFGFIGFTILTMVVYWLCWQAAQRRNASKEAARLEVMAVRARARVAAAKQNIRPVNGTGVGNLQCLSQGNLCSSGALDERAKRLARNGTAADGLKFADLDDDLVV